MILLATTNFFPLSISHSILLVITFNHVQSACILKSEKKNILKRNQFGLNRNDTYLLIEASMLLFRQVQEVGLSRNYLWNYGMRCRGKQ